MIKSIFTFVIALSLSAQSNAQQNDADGFKPTTIEQGYFEISRLPSRQLDGEIIVYDPDPETLQKCSRCGTRYRLDKDFRISVAGHITTEISLQQLIKLPEQLAYFRLFEEGTVAIVGFSELIEDENQVNGL